MNEKKYYLGVDGGGSKTTAAVFDGEALALDDLSDRLSRALPEALREDRHRLGLKSL